jgi:hypothetical protein
MRRLGVVLSLTVVVGMTATSPATAKGQLKGFQFDGHSVPGQRLSSIELLDDHLHRLMERAPYVVYLENMDDAWVNFGWPSPPLDEPIRLGTVDLRPFRYRGERRVEARLSFVVPTVSAGLYEVVVCNAGCADVVTRLGPTSLYVVSGAAERRQRNELDRLSSEVSRWMNRVVRLDGRLTRTLGFGFYRRLRAAEENVVELEREVWALRGRLADRSRDRESSPLSGPLVGAAIGVVAYGGVALARRWRPNRSHSG